MATPRRKRSHYVLFITMSITDMLARYLFNTGQCFCVVRPVICLYSKMTVTVCVCDCIVLCQVKSELERADDAQSAITAAGE